MAYKAVLISSAQDACLSPSIMDNARLALAKHSDQVGDILWLAKEEAAELHFDGATTNQAMAILEEVTNGLPIDHAILAADQGVKKLLLADMDSTIIAVECIDELADFANLKEQVSAITEAAMQGKLDFNEALASRVALLKGMDVDILEQCYQERVRFNPGARTLIQTMRAKGAYCALVSGGFTFFTGRVADALGFHMHRSNELGIMSGKLTGAVVPPISDAETKLNSLNELLNKKGLNAQDSIAVGDGANDIPMLEAAGLSIAYHAKAKAQEAAQVAINHGDLTALLYLQGIPKAEFSA